MSSAPSIVDFSPHTKELLFAPYDWRNHRRVPDTMPDGEVTESEWLWFEMQGKNAIWYGGTHPRPSHAGLTQGIDIDHGKVVGQGAIDIDLGLDPKTPRARGLGDWPAYILLYSLPDHPALVDILNDFQDRDISHQGREDDTHLFASLLAALDTAHDLIEGDHDPRALYDRIRLRSLRTRVRSRRADETIADRRLRAAIGRAQSTEDPESRTDWLDELGAVVYAYGSLAVDLLRRYWQDGLLRGDALVETLEELGYVDERSSHVKRRSLLVDVLADTDPDVRYAAAQGLVYLADPATFTRLADARAAEFNPMVQSQLDDAIEAVTMV